MPDRDSTFFGLVFNTVDYAYRNSPYYKELLDSNEISLEEIDNLSDFRKIPYLTRDIFASNAAKLITSIEAPNYVNCTSGSTYKTKRQLPLVHFHDNAEKEVVESLHNSFFEGLDQRPLTLNIVSSIHGYSHLHGHKGCFDIPLEKEHHLDSIVSILSESFHFNGFSERINILSGTVNQLKILTNFCIDSEIPSNKFQISTVISAGDWLTPKWRRIFTEYWKADVTNVYGLSEVNGFRSSICDHCGHHHSFPTSYVEFLDVNTKEEINEGIAELIVTPLYPVSQYQMLIRYKTGDVVRTHGICKKTGKVSFDFLGRMDEIIWYGNPNAEPIITPFEILRVLEEYPEIERLPDKRFDPFEFVDEIVKKPNFKVQFLDNGQALLILKIKLKYTPSFYPQQTSTLEKKIKASILQESIFLERIMKDKQINFQLKLY